MFPDHFISYYPVFTLNNHYTLTKNGNEIIDQIIQLIKRINHWIRLFICVAVWENPAGVSVAEAEFCQADTNDKKLGLENYVNVFFYYY